MFGFSYFNDVNAVLMTLDLIHNFLSFDVLDASAVDDDCCYIEGFSNVRLVP